MSHGVYVLGGWQSDFAERSADLYGLLQAGTVGALDNADVDAPKCATSSAS